MSDKFQRISGIDVPTGLGEVYKLEGKWETLTCILGVSATKTFGCFSIACTIGVLIGVGIGFLFYILNLPFLDLT